MAYKTEYSRYDNKTGLISTVGSLDTAIATLPTEGDFLIASDGAANDWFATSVAVGSGKIVIGAYNDDDNGSDSGSAYIYDLDGTNEIKITASDGVANDYFGESVAVGNNKIVVGAFRKNSAQGAIYIYDLDGTNEIKITASDGVANDYFGGSVAIGNNRIAVSGGANSQGAIYIYDLDGTNEIIVPRPSGAIGFGNSIAVGNNRIVVGAAWPVSGTGEVYVFDLNGNQLTKFTSSDASEWDYFGRSVAIGNGRIVVGAEADDDNGNSSGSAYIFDVNGNQIAKMIAFDGSSRSFFGRRVAIDNGKILVSLENDTVNSVGNAGSVYVFDLDGNPLTKLSEPVPYANSRFGKSLAIDSGTIVIGADGTFNNSGTGKAYIYNVPNIKDIFSIVDK